MSTTTPPKKSTVSLRPVQVEALEANAAYIHRGMTRLLTVLPTGAGKTVVFAAAPRQLRMLAGRRFQRVLVLAHRAELLDQAAKTFRRVEPKAKVAMWAGSRWDGPKTEYDVLVAGVQTISRPKRLAEFAPDCFDMIIVDEAHHAVEDSGYEAVIRHFGGFDDDGPYILGFTATPNRSDKKSLNHIFQAIAYARHLIDGMREGWLAPAKWIPVHIGGDLLAVGAQGDFDQNKLAALMDREEITLTVLARYLSLREELIETVKARPKTIVFAVTRSHAVHVVQAFKDAGIDARYIGGDVKRDERVATLESFARNEFEALVSVNLLLEGFDDSEVSVAVDLKPTRSAVLAAQEFGRPIRQHPGKSMAYYIQGVPEHAQEARMITVTDIFNLGIDWDAASPGERRALTDGAIHEAVERLESLEKAEQLLGEAMSAEAEEWDPAQRRAYIARALAEAPSEVVQLVEALPESFKNSDFIWQSRADRTFAVHLGEATGSVLVHPQDLLGRFPVTFVDAEGKVTEVIPEDAAEDADAARRSAERWIIQHYPVAGRLYLKSLAEEWMRQDATEKQKQAVRRLLPEMDAKHLAGLKRGVASRIIAFAKEMQLTLDVLAASHAASHAVRT